MFVQKIRTLDFILRDQDALTPDVIKYWIKKAREKRVNQGKIDAAQNHLAAIEEWQKTHPTQVKIPD
jgi:hypothetical protein